MNDYIIFDFLKESIEDVANYEMQKDAEHVRIACIDGVYEMDIDQSDKEPVKNIKKLDGFCIGFHVSLEFRGVRMKYKIISKEDADKYDGIDELTGYVCPVCGHRHKYFYNKVFKCPVCGIGELQEDNKNQIL